MGTDRRSAVTTRLAPWAVLWLALIGCGDALAHVTTTGLLRIEFTGGRMLYALSVALPELPAASAAILTAAANGDRAAAETAAEVARRSVTVDLDGAPLSDGTGTHWRRRHQRDARDCRDRLHLRRFAWSPRHHRGLARLSGRALPDPRQPPHAERRAPGDLRR